MADLKTNDLIEIFYKLYKEEYPDLTQSQMRGIVLSQFKMYSEYFKSGEFPTIRIKHLGVFQAMAYRARSTYYKMHFSYLRGRMHERDFDKWWWPFHRFLEKCRLKSNKYHEDRQTYTPNNPTEW